MKKAQSPRFICRTLARPEDGISASLYEEAAAIVGGQTLPVRTMRALESMSPAHQVQTVSLMLRQDNLTGDFARALLAATPADRRIDDGHLCRSSPDCTRALARIVIRLAAAQKDAERLRADHDSNLVFLTLAAGWVRTWIRDDVIGQWLTSREPAYLAALKGIVDEADSAIAPRRQMKLPYEPAAGVAATSAGKRRKKRRS
ncbi:hypothetical protein LMG28727_07700 [Paraburkholderia kirstenboschensis]|uniref:hypothetical protein n=1 Tax=Paraburkholderia kirstenboschensis TaxID=1245436 RepID=UPI00191A675A|nr:hypothetical protein [Paraburkholderia kirstenboschensis]CAD6562259.1 hypothetical protein LMG28727_07700 [Paraburkholderia kirstenboschensis]